MVSERSPRPVLEGWGTWSAAATSVLVAFYQLRRDSKEVLRKSPWPPSLAPFLDSVAGLAFYFASAYWFLFLAGDFQPAEPNIRTAWPFLYHSLATLFGVQDITGSSGWATRLLMLGESLLGLGYILAVFSVLFARYSSGGAGRPPAAKT